MSRFDAGDHSGGPSGSDPRPTPRPTSASPWATRNVVFVCAGLTAVLLLTVTQYGPHRDELYSPPPGGTRLGLGRVSGTAHRRTPDPTSVFTWPRSDEVTLHLAERDRIEIRCFDSSAAAGGPPW